MPSFASTIIFRIDCKSHRAHESLQRSLILAHSHVQRGGMVHIAIHQSAQGARELLAAQGFSEITITAPIGSDEDAGQLLCAVQSMGAQAVVVDGPSFDSTYLESISSEVYTAVLMDGAERVLPVQLIINSSYTADERFYTCRADSKLLLGPTYKMVDPQISAWPRPERSMPNPGQLRVFVATSDDDQTARILDCMPTPTKTTIVSVLASPRSPVLNAATRAACARGYIVEQITPSTVGDTLLLCDAAICSTDQDTALRGFYGVPSLALGLRQEDSREVHRLAEEGANPHHPLMTDQSDKQLTICIKEFIDDEKARTQIGSRLAELVDGQGTERVLDHLQSVLRPPVRHLKAA